MENQLIKRRQRITVAAFFSGDNSGLKKSLFFQILLFFLVYFAILPVLEERSSIMAS